MLPNVGGLWLIAECGTQWVNILSETREDTLNEDTGKSLSEALLFAEHGENMLCTKIVLNVRNNFCTQHFLPRFKLGIFHVLNL